MIVVEHKHVDIEVLKGSVIDYGTLAMLIRLGAGECAYVSGAGARTQHIE